MESNEKEKSKLELKRKLISNDLSKLLGALIFILLVAGVSGYVGYIYSKDNNLSISHGIIFGALFPLGVGLLEQFDCNNFFCFILYTIIYITIVSFIPTFVGVIILLLIIGIFIIDLISIEREDRTEKINSIISKNNIDSNKNYNYNINESEVCDKSGADITPSELKIIDEATDDRENRYINLEEEYECEMCFKKISEEEYELYDGMCEECFMDVHIDNDGNYHDEELF